MKPKSKKTPVPQLDLKDPPAASAAETKTEAKTFRSATLTTGRRSLFRDLREGETG